MFSGIANRCEVLLRRLTTNVVVSSRNGSKWVERQKLIAEGKSDQPMATVAAKKRIKHKKPDWIAKNPACLFVAGFPKRTMEQDLLQMFSQVGFVAEIRKEPNKRYGWVIMEQTSHADRARRLLHRKPLLGQQIDVYEGQRTMRKPIPEVIMTE